MSTNSRGRGRGRVQGGWANNNKTKPVTRPLHPANSSANYNSQSVSTSVSEGNLHHVPLWIGSGVDSDAPAATVKFQQPNEEELKMDEATTQMITTPGVHNLSSGPNGISRIKLFHNFLDPDYASKLYSDLHDTAPWEQKSDMKNGVWYLQPRMVAWYGDREYSYSGLTHPARPEWLPGLSEVRRQLEENTGLEFNSVLCNLYRDCKDHVAWHSDDESLFGRLPTIASVSLGDTRMFEMRKKVPPNEIGEYEYTEFVKIPLPSGSLLLMEGAAQLDWQHRIPTEYHDREPRINLTYRYITKQ